MPGRIRQPAADSYYGDGGGDIGHLATAEVRKFHIHQSHQPSTLSVCRGHAEMGGFEYTRNGFMISVHDSGELRSFHEVSDLAYSPDQASYLQLGWPIAAFRRCEHFAQKEDGLNERQQPCWMT
ncbi:hypothetical protein FQN53_000811 [Emmonsiellopsis sp. PD_33]|nr:hypothetical protein FQN53_000811 [Emmonsiellopsis sp. PD_33]